MRQFTDKLHQLYSIFSWFAEKLEPLLLLLIRINMGFIFVDSGWLKFGTFLNDDWDSTLFLFEEVHPVAFLSPEIAAVAGTGGELIFGGLLIIGLFGRISALSLLIITLTIEYSLPDAPTDLHIMWGLLIAVILVRGAGLFSIDSAIKNKLSLSSRKKR